MKDILILIGGAYIGWWLALNKEAETRQALSNTKSQLDSAKEQVVKQIKENEELVAILEEKGIFRAKEKVTSSK